MFIAASRKRTVKRRREEDDDDDDGEEEQLPEELVTPTSLAELVSEEVEHIPVNMTAFRSASRLHAFIQPLHLQRIGKSKRKANRLIAGYTFHSAPLITLPGLCRGLQRAFYPDFTFDKVRKAVKKLNKEMKAREFVDPEKEAIQWRKDNSEGLDTGAEAEEKIHMGYTGGLILDEQTTACINRTFHELHSDILYPVEEGGQEQRVLMSDPWGLTLDQMELLHPSTKAVLLFMTLAMCVPVIAQLGVWHPAIGRATAVDSIWLQTTTAQLVLIELKLSDTTMMIESHGWMRPPFQKFTNSLFNQFMLQLFFTYWMCRHTYQILLSQVRLVIVDNHTFTVQSFKLEEWVEKGLAEAIPLLRSRWVTGAGQALLAPPEDVD